MLKRRWTKLIRKVRWSLPGRDQIPLHWHIGRPNFGDDLNPLLFSGIAECQVRLCRESTRDRFLGMGSILSRADEHCVVVGSGLLDPKFPPETTPKSIISLRGQYTVDATGWSAEILGDPALLCSLVFPQSQQSSHTYGFIPHHSEIFPAKLQVPADWLLINPNWHPLPRD